MLIKLKEKLQVLYWNVLFILLGIVLIAGMHGYLSQLARFSMDEVNLLEEVSEEKEEQRRGATRITRSGRTIVQSYTLGQEYEQKENEGQINILIIGLLLLIFPFMLIFVYTLLLQSSQLAVNRTICMWLISIFSVIGIFTFEFNEFIHNGNATVFILSTSTILIIMFFSLFVSMHPNEQTSPYYRSKTELVIDEVNLAA